MTDLHHDGTPCEANAESGHAQLHLFIAKPSPQVETDAGGHRYTACVPEVLHDIGRHLFVWYAQFVGKFMQHEPVRLVEHVPVNLSPVDTALLKQMLNHRRHFALDEIEHLVPLHDEVVFASEIAGDILFHD